MRDINIPRRHGATFAPSHTHAQRCVAYKVVIGYICEEAIIIDIIIWAAACKVRIDVAMCTSLCQATVEQGWTIAELGARICAC